MGATPIYALPWPEGSDPPDGPVQIRASMLATEAGLTTVNNKAINPQQKWARVVGPANYDVTTGTAPLWNMSLQASSSPPPFTVPVGNTTTFVCNTPGLYALYMHYRVQALTNPGTTQGFVQVTFQGTGVTLDGLEPTYGNGWLDITFADVFNATAGTAYSVKFTNSSGVTVRVMNTAAFVVVRLAD